MISRSPIFVSCFFSPERQLIPLKCIINDSLSQLNFFVPALQTMIHLILGTSWHGKPKMTMPRLGNVSLSNVYTFWIITIQKRRVAPKIEPCGTSYENVSLKFQSFHRFSYFSEWITVYLNEMMRIYHIVTTTTTRYVFPSPRIGDETRTSNLSRRSSSEILAATTTTTT